MLRTDEELKKTIVDHLFWDDSIDASGVKVEVSNGKAFLTGKVLTYRAKDAAAAAAWMASGVQSVDNQLHVEFPAGYPSLTDDQIQHNAIGALAWNSDLHGSAIDVSVSHGTVILEGTVASYWLRKKAESIVSDLLGVVDVVNKLVVVPTEFLNDQTIAKNVQTAIRNSPFVKGENIKVSVKDGSVTLLGSVNARFDRLQAYAVAANCGGVIEILNKIEVQEIEG
jgi:osmotically-inducible protein OsmY